MTEIRPISSKGPHLNSEEYRKLLWRRILESLSLPSEVIDTLDKKEIRDALLTPKQDGSEFEL